MAFLPKIACYFSAAAICSCRQILDSTQLILRTPVKGQDVRYKNGWIGGEGREEKMKGKESMRKDLDGKKLALEDWVEKRSGGKGGG